MGTGIGRSDGDVGTGLGRDRDADATQVSTHRANRGRLGVDGEAPGTAKLNDEFVQLRFGRDAPVVRIGRAGRRSVDLIEQPTRGRSVGTCCRARWCGWIWSAHQRAQILLISIETQLAQDANMEQDVQTAHAGRDGHKQETLESEPSDDPMDESMNEMTESDHAQSDETADQSAEESAGEPVDESIDADSLGVRIEAALMATDRPVPGPRLAEVVAAEGQKINGRTMNKAVGLLNDLYAESGRSFRVEPVAGGWQIITLPAYADVAAGVNKTRAATRLSPAALETLAIIAYKQPVLKADIEAIRGVACGEVIRALLDRRLVKIVGRAEELGRPKIGRAHV